MIKNMLSPLTIADSIRSFHQRQTEDLEAFWIESPGSRQELIAELKVHTEGMPILVATVESGRFIDPNGVVDELTLTIQENEEWFTSARRELIVRDEKFSIVLVSKRPLGVPQLSSPVTLPDWFPLWPSRLLMAKIKNLNSAITLSLASQDIPEAAINNAFFELETALGARLDTILNTSPAVVGQLQAAIESNVQTPISISGLVASSKAGLLLRTAHEFRPGGSVNSEFIVSQLARIWRDCPPRDRYSLAASVADALGLNNTSNISTQYSLMSLLTRGKESLATTPISITFCRNLLGTMSDVVQFINGRHHADEFPQFPAVLTIAFASELAASCRDAADTIKQLA